ncbi:hypothetical protein HJC23_009390 [Cyclotella cryptica]|uniref:Uncharacterized protein n=1 Tax=Cyclotella cryptica TaxID=29204 RepID=A0ABD3PXV7_9STRA
MTMSDAREKSPEASGCTPSRFMFRPDVVDIANKTKTMPSREVSYRMLYATSLAWPTHCNLAIK